MKKKITKLINDDQADEFKLFKLILAKHLFISVVETITNGSNNYPI